MLEERLTYRPQTRMQTCSASTSSLDDDALDALFFLFAASLSEALRSPVQQMFLHSWRPQFSCARHVRSQTGCSS